MNFVVARNPDPDSRLPYLVRLPIDGGLILKVRDTWPRTSRVFCARVDARTTCTPGGAIHLTLDPARFHYFDRDTGLAIDPAFAPTGAPLVTSYVGLTCAVP